MGRRLRLYKIVFGLFKKKTKSSEELVQGKYFVVKQGNQYHVRTEGLETEITSTKYLEPANRLASLYNSMINERRK